MSHPRDRPRPTPGPAAPLPTAGASSLHPIGLVEVAGIAVCCVSAVLSAIVSVLLTPLYWGSVLFPVSVLLAAASNVALPTIARWLGASTRAAALPYGIWLIAVIVLGLSRPEGDVLLPAGRGGQPWVTYGMLLAGGLAGGVTLVARSMPAQGVTAQVQAQQASTDRSARPR